MKHCFINDGEAGRKRVRAIVPPGLQGFFWAIGTASDEGLRPGD